MTQELDNLTVWDLVEMMDKESQIAICKIQGKTDKARKLENECFDEVIKKSWECSAYVLESRGERYNQPLSRTAPIARRWFNKELEKNNFHDSLRIAVAFKLEDLVEVAGQKAIESWREKTKNKPDAEADKTMAQLAREYDLGIEIKEEAALSYLGFQLMCERIERHYHDAKIGAAEVSKLKEYISDYKLNSQKVAEVVNRSVGHHLSLVANDGYKIKNNVSQREGFMTGVRRLYEIVDEFRLSPFEFEDQFQNTIDMLIDKASKKESIESEKSELFYETAISLARRIDSEQSAQVAKLGLISYYVQRGNLGNMDRVAEKHQISIEDYYDQLKEGVATRFEKLKRDIPRERGSHGVHWTYQDLQELLGYSLNLNKDKLLQEEISEELVKLYLTGVTYHPRKEDKRLQRAISILGNDRVRSLAIEELKRKFDGTTIGKDNDPYKKRLIEEFRLPKRETRAIVNPYFEGAVSEGNIRQALHLAKEYDLNSPLARKVLWLDCPIYEPPK